METTLGIMQQPGIQSRMGLVQNLIEIGNFSFQFSQWICFKYRKFPLVTFRAIDISMLHLQI